MIVYGLTYNSAYLLHIIFYIIINKMHSCANEEWPRLFILFHEITPLCLLRVYYVRHETVVLFQVPCSNKGLHLGDDAFSTVLL